LIQQNILYDASASSDPEMSKLWNKSWDTIGAFFKDMKSTVVAKGEAHQEIKAQIPPPT
jgi:hypothetical protein